MKKLLIILVAMMATVVAYAVAVKDVENVHVKNRTRYVTDMAGVLSPQAVAEVDSLLGDVWQQSTAEPVVVIVDDLDGEDIDSYATELFELWGIGKKDKDNGVLMLISMNDRQNVIRTGYGTEGLIPDALAWGILNKTMRPYFREGDYDGGVIAASRELHDVMTSEEARQELMSKYANDRDGSSDNEPNLFVRYLFLAAGVTLASLVWYLLLLIKSRGKSTAEAYHPFDQNRMTIIILTFLTLGMMLPVLGLWLLTMRHIRLKKHLCTNCGTRMKRLDEQTDNLYLTPAQDAEERLNSVDYDVWLCPTCNQTDVIPYINRQKNYSICPNCGARTAALVSDRVLTQPTTRSKGVGEKTFTCFNCHHTTRNRYSIDKLPEESMAAPIILGGLGALGGRGGGGGGFSGGSFGGGFTGGGGARGGW